MGLQVGTEAVGYLWPAGRVAQGVTNAQRAVAQETVLALDMTTELKEKRIQRGDGLRSFWSGWPNVKEGKSAYLGLTAWKK